MFKSAFRASRFITVGTCLVLTICFASCSTTTKFQLLGKWTERTLFPLGDFPEEMQASFVQMEFFADNSCQIKMGGVGKCTYTILDNGSIKVTFLKTGKSAAAKIENRRLIIDWGNGEKQTVLDKGEPPISK